MGRTVAVRVVVGLAALLAVGCRSSTPAPTADGLLRFVDITAASGIAFTHDAGEVGSYFMPQAIGSGAALFDADGDGRLDLLLLNNGGPQGRKNALYRQRADGSFLDASSGSGLDVAGHAMGAAVGDVDDDGRPDVLITFVDGVRLFRNRGDGRFTDVTIASGLANPAWGTSAAFFDYDRDGRLDLVVANYVDYDPSWPCNNLQGAREYCAPRTFPGRASALFRNLGPGADGTPRFADVTRTSGLGRLPGPGLGVVPADYDGDGWPDLFLANDGKPNRLWLNRRDGTFEDEAVARGVAYNAMGQAEAGMGVALGDVDGNGLFDLFVTHLTEETNTLWKQGPAGAFRDGTAVSGLAKGGWRGTGFGTILADFDADSRLDVAIANGRVSRARENRHPELGPHWGWYGERNQLFVGDGAGRFDDVSATNPVFCGYGNVARGLVVGDLDNDGRLDLVVTAIGGAVRVLRNEAPRHGHWLGVRVLDAAGRRDQYGAVVTVEVGGRRQVRLVQPGGSFLTSGDPRVHFGLGDAQAYDRLTITGPDGAVEVFPGGTADRYVVLRLGSGVPR